MNLGKRSAPATARNREPILEVLARVVPQGARVLEVASGTGEHAVFLAERLPVASWQPSDPDPDARASIDAWRETVGASRVLPALDLDVLATPWPELRAEVLVCINMIHISPWAACEALLARAREVLSDAGLLYLYGPYRLGADTAPSNLAFDASLVARNPAWGVRELDDVIAAAARQGFSLEARVEMPANNLSLIFRGPRRDGAADCGARLS